MTTDASKKNSELPTGLELMPTNADFREHPHPILDRLRDEDPVHYHELMECYVLTRHEDAERVLQDRSLSLDLRKAPRESLAARPVRDWEDAHPDEPFPVTMANLDPPDHDRLRGLVSKAFTPRAIERMRPRTQSIADELLDRVSDRESFDIIADFSEPLPYAVMAEMLGMDLSFQPEFKRLMEISSQSRDPSLDKEGRDRSYAAGEEIHSYLTGVVEERRKSRTDDLISALIEAEEDGERLSTDELLGTIMILFGAGNITTNGLIGNGVFALLSDRTQFEKLRANSSLIENSVEEILRFDPSVTRAGRITLEDIEVGGCPVKAGSRLAVALDAVNHDPLVHTDPHEFDIEREHIHHQSFGGGGHYCLGASLARLETQVAISTLVRRCPNLQLAPQKIEHASLTLRSLTKLMVLT